ncbi:unnamed protein product [Paramecium primaurelia]|uniref:Uncharacterized protein n=1 Tax=Paramecium primaurelia TaxID=5886 RepID=A0A8S1MDQ9_PARPR|nr:unnamed protein product [Paramecium primaurelia]
MKVRSRIKLLCLPKKSGHFQTETSQDQLQSTNETQFKGDLTCRHTIKTKNAIKEALIISNIKLAFQEEIDKIKEEIRNPEKQQQIINEMLQQNRSIIQNTLIQLNQLFLERKDRDQAIKIINEISNQVLKSKIPDLKIFIHLKLAKIVYSYKLLYFSIILAKIVKRMSDNEHLLKYKLQAYKLLGICFFKLHNRQSKIYFTKYLMCSWKLNKKDHELKAYEYLGKYYFQEGDIDKATIFHERMVNGSILLPHSSLRILGIRKLEQGSIGKGKKNYGLVEYHEINVSSDAEGFELIFNDDETLPNKVAIKKMDQLVQNGKRQSLINYPIRKNLIFQHRSLHIMDNKIRTRNTNQLPVMLNHLSPNRQLVNYQFLELNKAVHNYKQTQNMDPYFEKQDVQYITDLIVKLSRVIEQVDIWIKL